MTPETTKHLRWEEHDRQWTPQRRALNPGLIRQVPQILFGSPHPWSETRVIMASDGAVIRRGALMSNTPEQARKIPAFIRRYFEESGNANNKNE